MFNVTPNGKDRITIYIYATGSIFFSYTTSNEITVTLDCLEDVYDYIREQFILNLEKTLNISRYDMTIQHLKIYEMLFS